jgi:hypothetical protein
MNECITSDFYNFFTKLSILPLSNPNKKLNIQHFTIKIIFLRSWRIPYHSVPISSTMDYRLHTTYITKVIPHFFFKSEGKNVILVLFNKQWLVICFQKGIVVSKSSKIILGLKLDKAFWVFFPFLVFTESVKKCKYVYHFRVRSIEDVLLSLLFLVHIYHLLLHKKIKILFINWNMSRIMFNRMTK